jgi:hypothetical protein
MSIEGIEVIGTQPGELHLSVTKLKGNQALAEDFQARFSVIPGVKGVEVNTAKGEVQLRYYKGEVTSLRSLWALKNAMSILFPEVNSMQLASYLGKYL